MTSIVLALDLIRLTPDHDNASGIDCPRCRAPLMIHQPDMQLPDRLLGTCDHCHAWFLIGAVREVMLRLPDDEVLWNR
jgi:hypothetical protein